MEISRAEIEGDIIKLQRNLSIIQRGNVQSSEKEACENVLNRSIQVLQFLLQRMAQQRPEELIQKGLETEQNKIARLFDSANSSAGGEPVIKPEEGDQNEASVSPHD